jgi:hypothetical protein
MSGSQTMCLASPGGSVIGTEAEKPGFKFVGSSQIKECLKQKKKPANIVGNSTEGIKKMNQKKSDIRALIDIWIASLALSYFIVYGTVGAVKHLKDQKQKEIDSQLINGIK